MKTKSLFTADRIGLSQEYLRTFYLLTAGMIISMVCLCLTSKTPSAAEAEIPIKAHIIGYQDVVVICKADTAPSWCPEHLTKHDTLTQGTIESAQDAGVDSSTDIARISYADRVDTTTVRHIQRYRRGGENMEWAWATITE